MNAWPALSEPIDPLETFLIAKAMSANTRDGKVQPFDEARTYAREQGAPDPDYFYSHSYEELAGGS